MRFSLICLYLSQIAASRRDFSTISSSLDLERIPWVSRSICNVIINAHREWIRLLEYHSHSFLRRFTSISVNIFTIKLYLTGDHTSLNQGHSYRFKDFRSVDFTTATRSDKSCDFFSGIAMFIFFSAWNFRNKFIFSTVIFSFHPFFLSFRNSFGNRPTGN